MLLVAGSWVVRSLAVVLHPAPLYMPDEYLYTSAARSLAVGSLPAVRGQVVRFPALLAPSAAAPFQALFSPEVAYRLTQVENALFMSLAAVPVYLIARRVGLTTGYCLSCAAFTVAVPDLLYGAFTTGDAVAYPLVLGALAVGLSALARPRARAQLGFLLLAGLAVFARLQYVVLPLCFLVAATAVDRRAVMRRNRVLVAALSAGALVAFTIGPTRLLGIYTSAGRLNVDSGMARWVGIDLFLLGCCAGAAIVPGAVVGLLRPRGRAQVAFSILTASLLACLVAQAALFGANGINRFQERYLFVVLPLIPVAFCLYLKNGRPWPALVVVVAAASVLVTPRLPLATYTAAAGISDSPSLIGLAELENLVGTANASLLIAIAISVLAAAAVGVARGWGSRTALALSIAFAGATSAGSVLADSTYSTHKRDEAVAPDRSWIDETVDHPVTFVQTPLGPTTAGLQLLYWNKRISKEVTLGPALATDNYATTPAATVAVDGTVTGVGGTFAFQAYAATAHFAHATLLARRKSVLLFRTPSAPRLVLLETGRYHDGWLAPTGTLTVWPSRSTHKRRHLRFQLSLPDHAAPVHLQLGRTTYTVRENKPTTVTLTVHRQHRPVTVHFTANRATGLPDLRLVSVRSTEPTLSPYEPQKR